MDFKKATGRVSASFSAAIFRGNSETYLFAAWNLGAWSAILSTLPRLREAWESEAFWVTGRPFPMEFPLALNVTLK